MIDENSGTSLRRRVLLGLGSGALLALSFPPYNLPLLLPAGIAVLVAALRGATVREGMYTGLACGFIYFGATLFWLFNIFSQGAITLIAIAASFPAIFGGLFAWIIGRLPRIPVWLIASIAWSGIEYLRSEVFWLNFGWMGLGYGVAGFQIANLIVPIFGSYGMTFVIVLFGAIAAASQAKAMRLTLLLILVYCFVFLGPRRPLKPKLPIFVHMVQSYSDDEDGFIKGSKPAPGIRRDVILWPEYSFTTDPQKDAKLWTQFQDIARDNRCILIFGAKDQFDQNDDAAYRNTAFVMDETGTVVAKHVKNHTVHFVRDGVRGTEAKAIPTRLSRIGVAICFDMDYPDVARRLVQDGAEVYLVPNDDPLEWGLVQREQHRLMFAMRAIECGRWLARADVAGGTSVTAPNGMEAARVNTTGEASLDAQVGRSDKKTLYVRGGWRFGQGCLVGLLVLLAYAAMRPRLVARRKLD